MRPTADRLDSETQSELLGKNNYLNFITENLTGWINASFSRLRMVEVISAVSYICINRLFHKCQQLKDVEGIFSRHTLR